MLWSRLSADVLFNFVINIFSKWRLFLYCEQWPEVSFSTFASAYNMKYRNYTKKKIWLGTIAFLDAVWFRPSGRFARLVLDWLLYRSFCFPNVQPGQAFLIWIIEESLFSTVPNGLYLMIVKVLCCFQWSHVKADCSSILNQLRKRR